MAMQVIKESFFWKIAAENNLNIVELKMTMRSLEPRIRKCYEETPIHLNSNELPEMMLFDGCFIVQLIQGIYPVEDMFQVGRIQTDIRHDLLLLENQLPLKKHSCQHPSPLGIKKHEEFKAKEAAAAVQASTAVVVAAAKPNSQRSWKFIRSATELKDNLINTGKDVQLLCESGVIDNWLGDDKAVTVMFNKLRDSIYMMSEDFYYADIFGRVNEHCKRKWYKWKAALKKNYFNTPRSLISFLAALVLLLLTLLQTIFSVLSYVKQ
uniref:Uncharacterized protein n=1 Tax=Gossypium raimondii TaxID=29730 RepID=A0A0D2U3C7_GOSRA|nr:hypothetical protein B456_013G182000 [Gossypium raimondii]